MPALADSRRDSSDAARSTASRSAFLPSSCEDEPSPRRAVSWPKEPPAEKISTISGSATTQASLSRPSALQLWVSRACSAFISAKLLLCAIAGSPGAQVGLESTFRTGLALGIVCQILWIRLHKNRALLR